MADSGSQNLGSYAPIDPSAWKGSSPKIISNILHFLTPIRTENGQLPRLATYCQYKKMEA
jgi:hypothetical protein